MLSYVMLCDVFVYAMRFPFLKVNYRNTGTASKCILQKAAVWKREGKDRLSNIEKI